jgi:hypothetical protein
VAVIGPGRGGTAGTPDGGHDPIQSLVAPPVAGGIGGIITGVADQIRTTVKPAAAAAVATTFGFPLILMVAVLLFLLVQSRLDGRDPKLRKAPLTASETVLAFRDEDQL